MATLDAHIRQQLSAAAHVARRWPALSGVVVIRSAHH